MKNLLLLLLLPLTVFTQGLPDSTVNKIDKLFSRFTPSTPGCAIAVVKNGEIVFKKGYGLAHMEYAVPITSSTIFHIASESKQYVAFCMLLLEQQGKLKLDDDIRKWLDYVPDFGKTITIRNLIYHTSGLRDQWQLLANAGWQLDDVITQDHVIKLVSKQKKLNFNPGEESLYCNTGYTLMAEIVKKTSGLSLRRFADSFIFKPLGMKDTHFHDDYQEIVPNRAYSYSPSGSGYRNAVLSYSIVGATSLFTTVEDEAKWLNNYSDGKVGGKELIEKMYKTGVLNSGKELKYAFAITIEDYKGYKRIGHGGGDAGFRTYACRFPEQELGVIVFSNLGSVNPTELCMQIGDFILPPKTINTPEPGPAADTNLLKRLQGSYYSHRGSQYFFGYENGKLLSRTASQRSGGIEWNLTKSGENRYSARGQHFILPANTGSDSVQSFVLEHDYGYLEYFRKPASSRKTDSTEYAGVYYNDETEAFYTVTRQTNGLVLQHRKYRDVPLNPNGPDQFNNGHWWMGNIRFLRNKKNKISGFEVNSGRILHLQYNKVK